MTPSSHNGSVLLDVNVLIAMTWPNHVHHAVARNWFTQHQNEGWATTPVTEAGFVRVSSNRAAIATPTSPAIALQLLDTMIDLPGHEFWVDDVRAVLGGIDPELLVSHKDVTDAHLLALADRHGGTLLTFDARIARLLGGLDPGRLHVVAGA